MIPHLCVHNARVNTYILAVSVSSRNLRVCLCLPLSCSTGSTELPFSSSSRGKSFRPNRKTHRTVPGQTLIHTPRRMPHSKLSNLAPHEAILHRKLATSVFLECLDHWATNLVVSLVRDELDTFGREIGIPLVRGRRRHFSK